MATRQLDPERPRIHLVANGLILWGGLRLPGEWDRRQYFVKVPHRSARGYLKCAETFARFHQGDVALYDETPGGDSFTVVWSTSQAMNQERDFIERGTELFLELLKLTG